MSGRVLILTLLLWSFAADAGSADRSPLIRWDFGAEETTPLRSRGGVHRDVPGPRPPVYPDFEPGNTAVKLDGQGALLSFEDPGTLSPFDFTNGDTVSLEAWVQVDELHSGENVYVIGKGRTGSAGFASDNQNWALRIRETQGKAGVSFLFATTPSTATAKPDAHWHRWTSLQGFAPGKGWHHIAVTYQFGDPASLRGWIDGQPQSGVWDMGGATKDPPIVDNDAIWIGSSRGGAAGNSFRGSLDAIAIHRTRFEDAEMKARFKREGPDIVAQPAVETMPVISEIPSGFVKLTVHEGMPAHDRWLNTDETWPPEIVHCSTEAFLLDRLPLRFDSWGIREAWKAPVLVRMATDVALSPGRHRLMMRVRGLSRLWVNGQLIARSKPLTGSPSGEEPITPVAVAPIPGARIAEHRQQEVFGEIDIQDNQLSRVVLETLVGGKAFRTDPGEICVARQSEDGKTFLLLSGANAMMPPVSLTDRDVEQALARLEFALTALDDTTRRAASASQNTFWEKRHEWARNWAQSHPTPPPAQSEKHPIDAFLAAKMDRAQNESEKTSAAEAEQFHQTLLPLLRDNCFRCHGDKEQGGLRLNTRQSALQAGKSEIPAVLPGKPQESELIRRIRAEDPEERMPPGANGLRPEQITLLEDWIKSGAPWPSPPISENLLTLTPVTDDSSFLRRVYLDTVGVPPTEQDLREFLKDSASDKRIRVIDQLLDDDRWADHWMSYWQDILAENPTLLNASLNTTGPFRWFLYDALRDDKPMDRLVTELILLKGSPHEGGSAGFGIAADNDAPFAAKGQIIASAFLGMNLQCARCHDSPYHSTRQRDLYALAAMLERKSVTVPKSSRVPSAFFEMKNREALIKVTLQPEEAVAPQWPFPELLGDWQPDQVEQLQQAPTDTRERLAALVTWPANSRFAEVLVNRVWRRLIGAGIVEPPDDWEGHAASHPELLRWLANEFIAHNYDLKYLARLVLSSQVYQRIATGTNQTATPELRFFAAPDRRRLSAEQIVDSLFAAAGQKMDVEEITFDPDGRRPASNRLTLGKPHRSWMFASLANERDRPSLSLPKARAITDILEAFGWSGSRQSPRTDRELSPHVLQPGVMANSVASVWLTRATENNGIADLAKNSTSPSALVESLFLRYFSRFPTASERQSLESVLSEGFSERVTVANPGTRASLPQNLPKVTWSNHLRAESTTIALELERQARLGPSPDPELRPEWRERYEDVIWSLVNLREFVWMP